MIDQAQLAALMRIVFNHDQQHVYAVLDGCTLAQLPKRLQSSGCPCSCLFSGALDPALELAAPWLVELPAKSPFTSSLLQECWNQHGGILLQTAAEVDLYSVRHHLRRFLRVTGPGGRPMLFRFYDPRAFRIAVPQLRHADYQAFLGTLLGVFTEADDPSSVLHFTADGPMHGSVRAFPLLGHAEHQHA
jgi:hypothetical protein